ncbi:tetratricopeptide (TPR) repeat protein [Oxalobacteraceae bacterium GrIS 1.11]
MDGNITGYGNILVQIDGDSNTVVLGRPCLTLMHKWQNRPISQDLERLSPSFRSTPLLGRQHEMASLQAFLDELRRVSVRVLSGAGGSGKTRLALELCEQANAGGWHAGFLSQTELPRFFAQQNVSAWGWQKPTLIVLDYAAGQAALLRQFLDELANLTHAPQCSLRLLLLERHADMDSGWWYSVFQGGWGSLDRRALLDPPEPVPIPPLALVEDRLALLQAMLDQVDPTHNLVLPRDDPDFRARLMQISWGGDPLFLMMAALEMVRLRHTQVLTLRRTDLATGLARREADRLNNLAEQRGLTPELVHHLAACITLAQGMEREAFEVFAEAEKVAIRLPSGGDAAQLAALLQQAFPRPDGIAPITPDLIGEAFILHALGGSARASAVLRCHAAFGQAVTESVIRNVQDYAAVAPAPLQWLDAIAQAAWDDAAALASLDASLPSNSTLLADVNLKVAQRLQELRENNPETPTHLRAAALHDLGIAQIHVGQRDLALRSTQEAVELYRELAGQRPDVFLPKLAMSLNNLANMLSALGRREPALLAAQEAVELYRELAGQRPGVFQPDLAMSLNNLANRLSALGRREPALLAAQEAVELYRELAGQRPGVFRPNLAASLNNLANMLSALDQREPALLAAQEAVELCRELAGQRPDVFQPDLAMSLNNLANRLSDLGRREPALLAAQEAVALCRELARQLPEVFQPNLARALIVLALQICDGDAGQAALAGHEAIVILRPVFLKSPAAYGGLMAAIIRDYLQFCESTGDDPDHKLLAELIPYLATME